MGCVPRRLRIGSAIPLGCALAVLWAAPANAQSDLQLFTPDTFELTGDVRIVAVDGEKSWVRGGFGKLRSSGGQDDLRVGPQLGNVSLVWKPQFTWSLSATVVGSLQGGERTEAGLSEAYLSFRPMRGSKVALSARAGLMWPPISLEHEGADWHVRGLDHALRNQQLDRRGSPAGRSRRDGFGRPRGKQAKGDRSGHGGERYGRDSAGIPRMGVARPHDASVSPPAAPPARGRIPRLPGAVHASPARRARRFRGSTGLLRQAQLGAPGARQDRAVPL